MTSDIKLVTKTLFKTNSQNSKIPTICMLGKEVRVMMIAASCSYTWEGGGHKSAAMTSVSIYITSAVTECDEWGGERVINAVCGDTGWWWCTCIHTVQSSETKSFWEFIGECDSVTLYTLNMLLLCLCLWQSEEMGAGRGRQCSQAGAGQLVAPHSSCSLHWWLPALGRGHS